MKLKSLTKPSSHQDRSASKKPKSQKRKRRYSSSDSSSADSARKKPRKSKKSKKKLKKKPRKFSVSPSLSSCSSDYSASSCSTCEKRKGRVSYGSKYKGKERGRSRRRSPSCSTCSRSSSSERSRSRSPKRSKRVVKDKERAKRSELSRVSEEREKVIPSYDDIVPFSKEEEKQIQKETSESEPVAEEGNNVAPVKHENDDGTKKTGVVDAELILRQKALENFIKFHKVKKCGISEESTGVIVTGKEIKEPTLDEPTKVITDIDSKEKGEIMSMSDITVKRPKLRSIIVVPIEKEVGEDNNIEVPNGIKGVADQIEEELDKGSEPTNPNFNLEVSNPSSVVVNGLRKDETVAAAAAAVEQSGTTQYEKKTFSRMHEGETVQVSYKVYIPKKAPALARRKLQRGETSAS